MRALRRARSRFIGRLEPYWYVKRGLTLGQRVHVGPGVRLDPSHCWLITIGDDVTIAPDVNILAHDASTKAHLGYASIGTVVIGRRTFIGAGTIVLPNVNIGDDVIIGAGSVVTSDIPARTVAVGSPAHVVSTLDDFVERHRKRMTEKPLYDNSWTTREAISADRKRHMRQELAEAGGGYVV